MMMRINLKHCYDTILFMKIPMENKNPVAYVCNLKLKNNKQVTQECTLETIPEY